MLDRFLIAFESIADSLKRIADASGGAATPDATPDAEPEKPARGRKSAKAAKADTTAPAPAPAPAPAKEEAPPVTAGPVTAGPVTEDSVNAAGFKYGTLKKAVIEQATKGGVFKQQVIDTLAHYGVAKADQIPAELWEDAYNRITGSGDTDEEDFA